MRVDLASLIDPDLWPLVAETRGFYARRPSRRGPANMDELRAARAAVSLPAACEPPPLIEQVRADGRTVGVRIHLPPRPPATGVLLDIHGGGFYLGSAADNDARNRALADALNVAVVGVDYRLAPEHPWPAAPEDCQRVALWLIDHAEGRFGSRRLAVAGFSAGATLAVTTLLRLHERGIDAITGGVLQFGTYDLSARTPAGRAIADEYFLTAYAGTAPDRTHPDLSPIFADLTGLPPVLIIVGAEDVLLADNLAMAASLAAAGVTVDLRVYPAAPHGFTAHPTPMAHAATDHIHGWLRERLGSPGPV